MSDLIRREDAVREMALMLEDISADLCEDILTRFGYDTPQELATEAMSIIPSAERKGEWIDCKEPPSTDRNVFIAYGTDDMKSVCIGHYEHDMKLWYEDKNFFAKPIYDAMYWCEIPQFPARMKGADDE